MSSLNQILAHKLLKTKNKKQNGFTLIELMVVVAIVGVLTAVGLPQLSKSQDKAKDKSAVATLTNAAKECSLELIDGAAAYDFPAGVFASVEHLDSSAAASAAGCVPNGILRLDSASGSNGAGGSAGTRATVTFTGVVPGVVTLEADT